MIEDFVKTFFGFGVTNSIDDEFEEFIEVDSSVGVFKIAKDLADSWVSSGKTEFFHDLLDLDGINKSTCIIIEEIEGSFKFLIILFGDFISGS